MRLPTTRLGSFLRKRRQALGLTAEDVGSQIGVTSQTVSDWELGKGKPKGRRQEGLAKALVIELDILIRQIENDDALATVADDKEEVFSVSRTLEQVLDEEANLPAGSRVIIASLFGSKVATNTKIAAVVAELIARGIKFVYAYQNLERVELSKFSLAQALGVKSIEDLTDNAPKFIGLAADPKEMGLQDLYRACATQVIVFDEPIAKKGERVPGHKLVRGYKFIDVWLPRPDGEEKKATLAFQMRADLSSQLITHIEAALEKQKNTASQNHQEH